MGNKLSGLGRALYDSKRREFLGRDGGRWAKLGVFYFFFYLGLAGFFCAMLAIFMALTPRDQPYYTSHASRMETRSNPLSPGLGFRPQPIADKNLIQMTKGSGNQEQWYANSLDQYLRVYYSKSRPNNSRSTAPSSRAVGTSDFSLRNPGDCKNETGYGYAVGRPCVLVKLNKIVDFIPEAFERGDESEDAKEIPSGCVTRSESIPITCSGEFPADVDNIGPINYISETGHSQACGSLSLSRFPYRGKQNRQDNYQAPYIWAQFTRPQPNVLINVVCRTYARNIDVDKKSGRGITRFQIFVDQQNQRRSGDF